ncbi:hypothetical protein JCM6882_000792 [Rhodosporidiobolus microsporus]
MAPPQTPAHGAGGTPPPRRLVVGSQWPSWDKFSAARIAVARISSRDRFPTNDFLSELDTRSGSGTNRHDRLCVGCSYPDAVQDGSAPCTFRLAMTPSTCSSTGLPCGTVSLVNLTHNHDFSLSSSTHKSIQSDERDFLDNELDEYGPEALERLKQVKLRWEHRLSSVDLPTEEEKERAYKMQKQVLDDLKAVLGKLDGEKWAKEAKSKRVLLANKREPLYVDIHNRKRTTSTPSSPAVLRVSQAPSPEPPHTPIKRQASVESPSEEARKKQKKAAEPAGPAAERAASVASESARKGTPTVIELEDSDEEQDVKPVINNAAPLPIVNAAPPPPAVAPALPVVAAPPAATPDPSPFSLFLASLSPAWPFQRYSHLFRRPTTDLETPEQLLYTAEGPAEDLDDLLRELGRDGERGEGEGEGEKGMPLVWRNALRTALRKKVAERGEA